MTASMHLAATGASQTGLAHEPRNASVPAADALGLEGCMNAGSTKHAATGCMDLSDAGQQPSIVTCMRRGSACAPRPVPARRDAEHSAESTRCVVWPLALNEGEESSRIMVPEDITQLLYFLVEPMQLCLFVNDHRPVLCAHRMPTTRTVTRSVGS